MKGAAQSLIMRALNGRDEDPKGRWFGGAVQSDWNGSAKVALISIERSERAWRTVAQSIGDAAAGVLAGHLERLRKENGEGISDGKRLPPSRVRRPPPVRSGGGLPLNPGFIRRGALGCRAGGPTRCEGRRQIISPACAIDMDTRVDDDDDDAPDCAT